MDATLHLRCLELFYRFDWSFASAQHLSGIRFEEQGLGESRNNVLVCFLEIDGKIQEARLEDGRYAVV